MAKEFRSLEQVEREISRLEASPFVKLARKEEQIRILRLQRLQELRDLEKKGRALSEQGLTLDMLQPYAD